MVLRARLIVLGLASGLLSCALSRSLAVITRRFPRQRGLNCAQLRLLSLRALALRIEPFDLDQEHVLAEGGKAVCPLRRWGRLGTVPQSASLESAHRPLERPQEGFDSTFRA